MIVSSSTRAIGFLGRIGLLVGVGLVAAACASPGASPHPPTLTADPTSPVDSRADASPLAPPPAEPPGLLLGVDGGDPVAGQLGSYTWQGVGSDAPWLPGTPLSVGSTEVLTARTTERLDVVEWSARAVPAGRLDGLDAVPLGVGTSGSPAFRPPAPGSWSVQVSLRFAAGIGSASWYWQLDVR